VQLGGAAGTLAPFGDRGLAIARALAEELKLRPSPPWHTDRGRIAAVVSACAILGAALAKVARDIVLLMQPEVGEVAAPGGGSSTMPHKQNPSGCAVVLAAAARLPGLASASLAAMANEHERGVGGVQAEWPIVVTAVQAAGAALAAMAGTIEGVKPDPDRMRANLAATRGTVFAERATLLLRRSLGDERAAAIVAAALDRCRRDGVSFAAALGAVPEAARALGADLDTIDRPEDYLGAADAIRRELLTD
jgi:3-carboxy-cis,cis-muconate cycloisomerase